MSVFGGEGTGVKSVSFKFGPDDSPDYKHRGMIVLEWLPEQQATEYVEGGAGKPKFWNGPNGQPDMNSPIMTQPVLVWHPGWDGQGLRDSSVEGDFGVRTIWFEKSKDLTKKMGAAMRAGGRRGQLWPGDVIGTWWTHKQGSKKIYEAEFTPGDARTQGIAQKALTRHKAWVAARDAAAASPNGNAGSTFADEQPSAAASAADDPRGWSTGGAAKTPEPVGAATGGGLFDDDAPF